MAKLNVQYDSETGRASILVDGQPVETLASVGLRRDPESPQKWLPEFTVWASASRRDLDRKFGATPEARLGAAVASFLGRDKT